MAVNVSLLGPGEFPYDDESRYTAGTRWPIWIRDFELFLVGSGVEDADQKKAILLYTMGGTARSVYYTLKGASDDYEQVKKVCATYFAPFKNLDYEMFMFGRMRQRESESLDDFIIRLRVAAERCEFDAKTIDAEIKRQVISGCHSAKLIQQILSKVGISLADIQTLARVGECASTQAKTMEALGGGGITVKKECANTVKGDAKCYACGREFQHQGDCPAKDKKCSACGELGHFAVSKYCKKGRNKRVSTVTGRVEESDKERPYLF